jgi:hypothetical protein
MSKKYQQIVRGEFYFRQVPVNCVQCTLGDPDDSESEHIFTLHESYLDEIIAGLKALKSVK